MGITYSFAQLVMDNEFVKMIKFLLRGISVSDEPLAVDVIREVGAFNDFLCHDHTLKHLRTAQSQGELIDRRNYQQWKDTGATDMPQRAAEEARHIIETHKPEPLPSTVVKTLRSIVEEAEDMVFQGLKG